MDASETKVVWSPRQAGDGLPAVREEGGRSRALEAVYGTLGERKERKGLGLPSGR